MITISILTFNRLDVTQKCLESIFKTTPKEVRKVVSDNGSTDGTREWLKSLGDKIWYVENEKNFGFATAHNQIIRVFGGDIILINNDIEVPEKWLEMLTETINQGYGAVSPAIQTPTGLDVGAVLDKYAKGKSIINDTTIEPTWITGSCIYITRDTFKKIGTLDEQYVWYYEDVDFCVAMKRKGILFKCDSRVVIQHHNSASSTPTWKKIKMEDSRGLFINKWGWGR